MKSICDLLKRKPSIENSGDNYGVEAAANSGLIVVNQGMGYDNTKALCLDVVSDELNKYKAEAYEEAKRRDSDLFEKVVAELSKRNMTDEQALSEFREPSMQYDYAEAQKAYIKAGTPELASVLSNILAERIGESSRTLLQIALGESIQVAPKLIETQMATLALAFVLKHTVRVNVKEHGSLVKYIQNTVLPIYKKGVSQKPSEFQHLNFTGCSQYSAVSQELPSLFLNTYSGLFMKGIEKDKLPKDADGKSFVDLYPNLFLKCLNNNDTLQINAMSEEVLTTSMDRLDMSQEHQQIFKKLFKENRMSEEAVQELVVKLVPEMQDVFDYWANSEIALLTLTSVGIVIGAQYAKIITGQDYNLNIWI
ncbi:MAG: hypothetical protein LUH58_10935 [Lachnospiraceae bacterium]|nr:hypothetical protein [Lachnospiraceae bacterium]